MRERGILWIRLGLPLAIAVAGIVLILIGSAGLGATLVGIAVIVALVNLFIRLSIAGEKDIERDEAARDHYSRTGRWPGE